MIVMIMADCPLIFTVLVLEFRSFMEPIAIVAGVLLLLLGTIAEALYITGISENIISAIEGDHRRGHRRQERHPDARLRGSSTARTGLDMVEGEAGAIRQRRLCPVLMTSMAAALGMLPLAYGIGSGADMLRPLAVAVIGALCISVLLSLVATPAVYFVMRASCLFARQRA